MKSESGTLDVFLKMADITATFASKGRGCK